MTALKKKGSAHEIGIYTYDCLEDQAFRSKPDNGDGGKKKDKQMPGVNTGGTYELEDVKVVMASEAAARVSKQGKYIQVMAPLDVDYAPGFLASNQSTAVKSSKGGAQKQSAKKRAMHGIPDKSGGSKDVTTRLAADRCVP